MLYIVCLYHCMYVCSMLIKDQPINQSINQSFICYNIIELTCLLTEGSSRNGVVMVGVGGGWTVLVIGVWLTTYCRCRPNTSNRCDKTIRDMHIRSSVELVSISWRDTDDDVQHYTVASPCTRDAVIS